MQTQSKKMHGARGEENRPRNGSEEAALTLKTWWLIGPFHLCQTFSSCSIFASVFWFFLSSASSSPSLPGSCTFSFPVLHMLYAEKWKQRPKRQSLLDYGFSFFSRFSCLFFSFFSSTACLPDLPTTQGWRKETPSFSVFFSPTPCLFYVFSCLSFLIFSSTPPFLLFSFPVQWSLHSNQRMKEKASPPFLRCGLFWEPKQKPVGGGGTPLERV